MNAAVEKVAFSRRLTSAITRFAPSGRLGASWLAREFNQRYQGRPISVHAARKWLLGETIPSHDKLLTLAGWLRVSSEWLLYGEGEMLALSTLQQKRAHYTVDDADMLREFSALNSEHRRIVREMVMVLAKIEGRSE